MGHLSVRDGDLEETFRKCFSLQISIEIYVPLTCQGNDKTK